MKEGKYGLLFGVIAGCIAADYGQLLEEDGTVSFIRLIKWVYRHQLFQQALTLIEAHAPSHLVGSGIFITATMQSICLRSSICLRGSGWN